MKRKTAKKMVAMTLAATMSLGGLTACGGSTDTKDTTAATTKKAETTTTAAGAAATPAVDKNDPAATAASNGLNLPELDVLKLEVSIPDFNISSDGTMIQELWEEKMEAYLGVDLDITWTRTPWSDFRGNEMIILQSGMLPDVSSTSKGSAINEFGEDGALLNLSDYTDYMVYYTDYMEQTNGGEAFCQNEDGSMYYFMDGFYNPDDIMGAQSFTSFAYRFDILKENNLQPATTVDEFTKLCADLQSLIDQGKIDTKYVIMNSTKDYAIYRGFIGLWHTWDCLYYTGDEWSFGPIEDDFREMLAYLNELYEAGYIDPEFATLDYNQGVEKATTGTAAICPTLWAGSVAGWNTASTDENMEWGLAYLPDGKYGTSWKWGSKQDGKSVQNSMGIYINAEVENPEYVVAMIDYQYSDQMVELLNWGVEGVTYNVVDGEKVFVDEIMNADSPATKSAEYGLMSSSVCRTGICFTPIDFNAMLDLSSLPEPWWNEKDGYYEGKYWEESSNNGGVDSVSPYDRAPVTYLTTDESTAKAQLAYGGVCEVRVRTLAYEFIVGERDIHDDAAWAEYIRDIKSQCEDDFDEILETLNAKTVK